LKNLIFDFQIFFRYTFALYECCYTTY